MITTVVWLRRWPGGSVGRVGRAALRVPAEHHRHDRDGQHHGRPDVERDTLARTLAGGGGGDLWVAAHDLVRIIPTPALGYRAHNLA